MNIHHQFSKIQHLRNHSNCLTNTFPKKFYFWWWPGLPYDQLSHRHSNYRHLSPPPSKLHTQKWWWKLAGMGKESPLGKIKWYQVHAPALDGFRLKSGPCWYRAEKIKQGRQSTVLLDGDPEDMVLVTKTAGKWRRKPYKGAGSKDLTEPQILCINTTQISSWFAKLWVRLQAILLRTKITTGYYRHCPKRARIWNFSLTKFAAPKQK